MKKLLIAAFIIFLSGCMQVGKFSPERHAQHELGRPDCDVTPEKCIHGVPW